MRDNGWARLLAYVRGVVSQRLLLQKGCALGRIGGAGKFREAYANPNFRLWLTAWRRLL
jgi:hypothetical protein